MSIMPRSRPRPVINKLKPGEIQEYRDRLAAAQSLRERAEILEELDRRISGKA